MKDSVDYKKKYQDIRSKMITSMDMAFRQGYEMGLQEATIQQAQQAQMQAQQMQAQAQAQMQGQPGAAEAEAPMDQGQMPEDAEAGQPGEPSPEELDQYIQELEDLVNKSEMKPDDIKKSINKIKNFQINTRLAKSLKGFKMPKAISLSHQASKNLTPNSKKEISMQEKIIDDIMKKWGAETPKAVSSAMQTLGTEALTKKE